MEPENIAIVVTVSVLGGVVIIALVIVCFAKFISDKKLKKLIAREQEYGGYGDTMALEETHEHPSYVHYPEPEPYTPTHPPETDPWRMSNIEPVPDTHDHGMPGYDPSRRPSLPQPYSGPPNGVTNMQRRASDMPRKGPYVGGVHRRVSRAEILGRHKGRRSSMASSRAPSSVSQIPKLPTRRGSLQPNSGPPTGENKKIQGRDKSRRSSMDVTRKPSTASHIPNLPTRRGSLQSNLKPPTGENRKLWYFYINEESDYISRELERKRELAKERAEKEERSRASEHSRVRRMEPLAMPHSQSHPVQRQPSFQHSQPYSYPHNPGPSTQYM